MYVIIPKIFVFLNYVNRLAMLPIVPPLPRFNKLFRLFIYYSPLLYDFNVIIIPSERNPVLMSTTNTLQLSC